MTEQFIQKSIDRWSKDSNLYRLDMHEWQVEISVLQTAIDSTLQKRSEAVVWHPDSNTKVNTVHILTDKCDIVFRMIDTMCDEVHFFTITEHEEWLNSCIQRIINAAEDNDTASLQSSFYMVTVAGGELKLSNEALPALKIDMELNYGVAVSSKYPELVLSLLDDQPGFYVLYGDTGTGKKHFIKSIIHSTAYDKTIIYLPGYLLADLASHDFISFLSSQRGSILIVEDAEDVLMHRKDIQSNSIVNNLLNLTMGLLANELGIKVLVSCNCTLNQLDKLLLRPGTITWQQEFKKLDSINATKLSKSLDINKEWKISANLAEIYANDVDKSHASTKKKPKRVGFKADDKD